MESTALSVCIMEAPENIPTVFEDVFVALPTVSGQVVYDAIVNHLKLVEKRYDMNRVHIYFIPPDTSRLLWIKPVVSKEKLDSYVEIDKDTNFENFLELPVIKNSPKLRTEYQEGLPSGARFVAVLPQLTTLVDHNQIDKAVADALNRYEFIKRLDPFARSHHSDSISAHSPIGNVRHPQENERTSFKNEVIKYYGLETGEDNMVFTMLGDKVTYNQATLAHIWPKSYTNWGEISSALGLPGEFYKNHRNFMILPKDLHDDFDNGYTIFTPHLDNENRFQVSIHKIDMQATAENPPERLVFKNDQRPYCRILAFFALMAKKYKTVNDNIMAAIDTSLNYGTDDSLGRKELVTLAGKVKKNYNLT